MVNRGKDSVGYLIIGVADKIEDARAVEEKTNEKSIRVGNFYITGINHDISLLNTDDDRYFQKIIQKIKAQPIEEDYKTEILNNISL